MTVDRLPALEREAFHCPFCGVYARQIWRDTIGARNGVRNLLLEEISTATCSACEQRSIWVREQMVHPRMRSGVEPHADMPDAVRAVYDEARDVEPMSRKSAAGLLRLALQMLVDDLEPGKGSIDSKIGSLVARGLDPNVQKAMDVLRVVGNESVHPGEIDLDADDELLPGLFNLANLIVEQVITRPKHVGGLFSKLPPQKLEAIERRDGTND